MATEATGAKGFGLAPDQKGNSCVTMTNKKKNSFPIHAINLVKITLETS